MARPTEYSNDFVQRTYDYIEQYEVLGDKVPSVEGLACELGVATSSIYLWEKNPNNLEFSEALSALRARQARVLINNGLDGTFTPAITKLMMHNHGYSDKQSVDLESPNGTMSPQPIATAADVLTLMKQKHAKAK